MMVALFCLSGNHGFALLNTIRRTSYRLRSDCCQHRFRHVSSFAGSGSAKRCSAGDDGNDSWAKWEYGTFRTYPDQNNPEKHHGVQVLDIPMEKHVDPMWKDLSDDEVQLGISALRDFCSAERLQKMQEVLDKRTSHIRIVFENPGNANNMWAALRTFDSFGIQFTDIIIDESRYTAEWRSRTMKTALGIAATLLRIKIPAYLSHYRIICLEWFSSIYLIILINVFCIICEQVLKSGLTYRSISRQRNVLTTFAVWDTRSMLLIYTAAAKVFMISIGWVMLEQMKPVQ